MRRVTFALAAVLSVLALSACNDGGGDGGAPPAQTEPAPTPQ